MSRAMRRIGTPIALAGYLLATIAASLHQHDHSHVHFDISSAAAKPADTCEHVHVGCSHSHASTCSHSHGDKHLAETGHRHHDGAPTHHHHGGIPLHDDGCAVCQFHAVQYVSTPAVAVVGLFEIIRLSEPLAVLRPQVPKLSRPLSRGPPTDVIA